MEKPGLASLKEIPLLARLGDDELKDLAEVLELRRARKGKCVLRSEEPGQFMMFVLAGKLNVLQSNQSGREFILDVLGPGDFFGELSLLTGEPRSADVEASEDSTLLVLSQDQFERHMLRNQGFSRSLLRELAIRLRETSYKATDLALVDVYTRIAHLLRKLSRASDGVEGVIDKRPTHRELAAMAGTSREMVTRALREMETAGQIEVKGKKLILRSLPA